jgi:hypothetical protein
LEYFHRDGGSSKGPIWARIIFRAALPCLALIVLSGTVAQAQTVTPDLFSPTRNSQILAPDSPLRRTAAETNDPLNNPKLRDNDKDKPAPSRIGQIPRYGLPAASGASSSGYDSLNRKLKKPKYYPGQAETAARPWYPRAHSVERPAAAFDSAVAIRQQDADPAGDGGHGDRLAATQTAEGRRRSVRPGRRLRRQLPDQIGG